MKFALALIFVLMTVAAGRADNFLMDLFRSNQVDNSHPGTAHGGGSVSSQAVTKAAPAAAPSAASAGTPAGAAQAAASAYGQRNDDGIAPDAPAGYEAQRDAVRAGVEAQGGMFGRRSDGTYGCVSGC